MLKAIKKTIILILKNFSILLILFVLCFSNNIKAEDNGGKFIGFIDTLEGTVNKVNDDGLIKLAQFDQIFVQDQIKIGPNSLITISFIDNSILTFEADSEFFVEKFDNLSEEPSFIIAITKGKFAFESGTIAKNDKGIMKIMLSEMEVGLKGTLVTGANSDETKKISLVKDSMGNVGELDITVDGQTTNITEEAAGLNLSGDNQIESTTLSEEEKNEVMGTMNAAVVQASTQSVEKIERAITSKLAAGTIPDANGDGIADLKDVEIFKAGLLEMQEAKLEYIVEESKEDLSILSEIIVNSESDQSMQLMEDMMETNADSAALLMTEIVEQDFDIFSHVAKAETGNFEELRETIVTEMIEDESDFVADTMAQMMAVSDAAMSSYMVNEIANIEVADDGANMAMDVLTAFSEVASEKMDEFFQADPNMMDALTTNAFENATEDDVEIISDMMQEAAGESTAFLMASMVEHNAEMIADVYEDLAEQDFDLFHHIETAKAEDTMMMYDEPAETTLEEEPFITSADPFMPDPDPFVPDPFMPGPESIMEEQEQFVDNLKGEIFSEIINHGEGTAAEITADLMMNSRGDSAMFMMEIVMEENPEIIADVMQNFVQEDFDIFEHFEKTYEEPTIVEKEAEATAPKEKKRLTKEERQVAKAEKKAAKIAKKEEKQLEKQLKKEEKELAKLLNLPEQELEFEDPILDTGFDIAEDPAFSMMQDFQADIIGTMMDHGGEESMETVAYMMSTGDDENSAFILETMMEHEQTIAEAEMDLYDPNPEEQNLTLALLDEMSDIDPDMMNTLFEEQEDLMQEVIEDAFADVSEEDNEMMTDLILEAGNETMRDMMFEEAMEGELDEDTKDELFVEVAEEEPEMILTLFEDNEELWEEIAEDHFDDDFTLEDLEQEISEEEGSVTERIAEGDDFVDEDEQAAIDAQAVIDAQAAIDAQAVIDEQTRLDEEAAEQARLDEEAAEQARLDEEEAEQTRLDEEEAERVRLAALITAPTWGTYYTYLTDRELGSLTLPYEYLYAEEGQNNTELQYISSDLTNLGLSLTTDINTNYASIGGTLPSAGNYNFDVYVRDSIEPAQRSPTLTFYFTVATTSTTWTMPSNPETIYNLGELRFGYDPYYDGYNYTSFLQTLDASTGPSETVNFRLSPDQVKEFAYDPANDLPLGLTVETEGSYGAIVSTEIEEVLAVDTDFTFTVRAEEVGNESDFNDRNFRVTILADPRCVSPAQYDCPL